MCWVRSLELPCPPHEKLVAVTGVHPTTVLNFQLYKVSCCDFMEKRLSGCPTECASSHLISFLCHPFLCHPSSVNFFLCHTFLCHRLSLFVTLCHPFSPFSLFPFFHIIFQRFSPLYQFFAFPLLFSNFPTFKFSTPSTFSIVSISLINFSTFSFLRFFTLFQNVSYHFVLMFFQIFNFSAGRKCLMLVVFMRRMMSTLQWSRPETSVSFQPTRCLSVNFIRSTKRTTEPDTAQTERILTRLVDTISG